MGEDELKKLAIQKSLALSEQDASKLLSYMSGMQVKNSPETKEELKWEMDHSRFCE